MRGVAPGQSLEAQDVCQARGVPKKDVRSFLVGGFLARHGGNGFWGLPEIHMIVGAPNGRKG